MRRRLHLVRSQAATAGTSRLCACTGRVRFHWVLVLVALFGSSAPALSQDQVPRSPLKPQSPRALVSPLKSAVPGLNRIVLAGARRDAAEVDSGKTSEIDDESDKAAE